MLTEKITKRNLALFIIIALAVALFYSALPYINAILAAFVLFVLFKPLHDYFVKKLKINTNFTALIIIILAITVVVIPIYFILIQVAKEIQAILADGHLLEQSINLFNKFAPQLEIQHKIDQLINEFATIAGRTAVDAVSAIGSGFISYTIMFFLLYFLLIADDKRFQEIAWHVIPFNKENTNRLGREFKKITYTTLVSTGLIALLQGTLLGVGFVIFGIKGAFLWGMLGIVLSFLPVVGVPIIWLPAVLVLLFQQNYLSGFGLLAWGLFISNFDNFLRPYLQKKVGNIHPFESLLGVFLGLSLFGLIGIIVGPLLLSYFLLLVRMFKEEYIAGF